jgi:cell division protein FtsZ
VFAFPTANRPAVTPAPVPTPTTSTAPGVEEEPLDLTQDDEATDELLLENDDILADPVMGTPIAPPTDEEEADGGTIDEAKPAPPAGTLFERMSNIARGAAQAKVEDEPAPSFRREPLDIPRFLNRQNNQ